MIRILLCWVLYWPYFRIILGTQSPAAPGSVPLELRMVCGFHKETTSDSIRALQEVAGGSQNRFYKSSIGMLSEDAD